MVKGLEKIRWIRELLPLDCSSSVKIIHLELEYGMPSLRTLQSCYRGISESIHCPYHSSLKHICTLKNAYLILQWYDRTIFPIEIVKNPTSFFESVHPRSHYKRASAKIIRILSNIHHRPMLNEKKV